MQVGYGSKLGFCLASVTVFGVVLLVGCGKGESRGTGATNGSVSVSSDAFGSAAGGATSSVEMCVQDMPDDTVIVSVNGATLTPGQFKKLMENAFKAMEWDPQQKSPQQLVSMKRMVMMNFIPNFVSRQLLAQEARRQALLSDAETAVKVDEAIAASAKKVSMTPEALLKAMPSGESLLRSDMALSIQADAAVRRKIDMTNQVSDAFVAAAVDAIKAANAEAAVLDQKKVERLRGLRREILAGADFGKLAEANSECQRMAPGNGGYWGDYERTTFADRKMRAAIFSLKPGEVSDILEDEEGYHLVKVLEVTPELKDEKGVVTRPETISLAHILLRYEPRAELASSAELKDLFSQQQRQQKIDTYIDELKGSAQIVYPHGTNFWSKSMKSDTAGSGMPVIGAAGSL